MMSFFKNLSDPNKRYFFLLAAVIISLPIQMNINALWISIFSLNAIVSFRKKNFESDKGLLLLYFLYFLFFIVSSLSLIYSENLDLGLSKIQTKLGFLALPFAFASNLKNLKKSQIQWLLRSFIISVLACTIFCYLESSYHAIVLKDLSELYDSSLSNPLMHRAYFSLFLGMGILLWWADSSFLRKYRIWGIVLFALTIVILQGRINILAFLLVSIGLFVFKTSKSFSKKQNLIGIALGLLLILGYSFLPKQYNRFNQSLTLEYNLSDTLASDFTGLTIRLAVWDIAIPMAQENKLFGLGIGDSKDELLKKYEENGFVLASEKKYNCHNQFIETTLASGIITLVILLGILIIYLIFSYQSNNLFLSAMVIYFFISMITESLLERHWGISLLTILIPLYLKFSRSKD